MHIVLVEPEIPGNTGNIARLCAATGCKLHLVRPLGFSVDDKYLKRAGLDYWNLVDISYYNSIDEVLEKFRDNTKFLLTTKAHKRYTDVKYDSESLLIFGKETAGLPEKLRLAYEDSCVRIPMIAEARSLNLSNSVAIVAYEALRQQDDFAGLSV
ncbi:MAG: tRNA (uridine(34)/cytosine(34)/5-carboxymethylaminomethyluridine(34)-2'-O)-methyltransferase TrmL [Negativicutes bacterium]|nr:tRNA (uridine(34)/cytosine(34)/5-carboxymethylaminomethyluridine(34)-2'-O)-methyltransferase TrmL [Negativicutes bacterium]